MVRSYDPKCQDSGEVADGGLGTEGTDQSSVPEFSEKGGVSGYGRFPVTLYKEQCTTLRSVPRP